MEKAAELSDYLPLASTLACELADFHRPSPYRTSINSTPKL